MAQERDHHYSQHEPERPDPLGLPSDLAAFLRTQRYACLTHATEDGRTAFVVKAPAADLATLRGPIPIELRHELYHHPAAPVIRTLLICHDRVGRPLSLESFTNVGDPQQRAEFAALAEQREAALLFYDESLQHRLSKRVRTPSGAALTDVLRQASFLLSVIPPEEVDFDRAKDAVLRLTNC